MTTYIWLAILTAWMLVLTVLLFVVLIRLQTLKDWVETIVSILDNLADKYLKLALGITDDKR